LPIGNKYNFSIGVGVNPQTGKGYNISGEDDLVVRGDLNANSKIDQGDVTLIKKLVSGL
jgi:hypothetical protein